MAAAESALAEVSLRSVHDQALPDVGVVAETAAVGGALLSLSAGVVFVVGAAAAFGGSVFADWALAGWVLSGSVSVGVAASATGWLSRSNQLGAGAPDPAGVDGRGSLGEPPLLAGSLLTGSLLTGSLLAGSLGVQLGRAWFSDDHGGCDGRVCQSAAESASRTGVWPNAWRRCPSGGLLPADGLPRAGLATGGPAGGGAAGSGPTDEAAELAKAGDCDVTGTSGRIDS